MRRISDLTKDTRPELRPLLIKAIKDTAEFDRVRETSDAKMVEYENDTFYYRAIYLFSKRAIVYYSKEEIEVWSRKNLLGEVILPELKGYGMLGDLK